LLDFDWRLDTRIDGSNEKDTANINVFIKLESFDKEKDNKLKSDLFQLNKGEVNTFYESLLRVKQ